MWNALMAAVIGIFGGLFGIGASAGMIHQSAEEAPRPTIEEKSSWWENGNQVNEESHGQPTNPETFGVPTEEKNAAEIIENEQAAVFIDVTDKRTKDFADETGADAQTTVLSGDY